MWPVALFAGGIAIAYSTTQGPKNLTKVTSTIDDRVYNVQNLPDKQEAADLMAKIRGNIDKLFDSYKSDPASIADHRISVMIDRFKPDNMYENDITANTTSYSENKGDKIVLCIRDKQKPYSLIDENTIMFVLLHEMAHLMTTTIGHTPEFWTNFRRILQDATKVGIYMQVNYAKDPVAYCGMEITDSPM